MPTVKTQTLLACVGSSSCSQRKKTFPRLPFRRWAAKGTTASRLRLSTVSRGITERSQPTQYRKISRKDAKSQKENKNRNSRKRTQGTQRKREGRLKSCKK